MDISQYLIAFGAEYSYACEFKQFRDESYLRIKYDSILLAATGWKEPETLSNDFSFVKISVTSRFNFGPKHI